MSQLANGSVQAPLLEKMLTKSVPLSEMQERTDRRRKDLQFATEIYNLLLSKRNFLFLLTM